METKEPVEPATEQDEAWMADELATPISAEWIEEDLEKTPTTAVWIVEDDGTIASENFQWVVPAAGAKERWRL